MASLSAARIDAAEGRPPAVTLGGWIRLGLRSLALLALLVCCVPMHYIWRALRIGSPWPKLFLGWAARACGAQVEVRGTPLHRDVFFVANHVSWIDILAMGSASGTAFVAKAELADAPVVGWLCGLNRTLFVKREDKFNVADQINQLRDALADNWSVTVFPEATTTDGQSLLPFKTSMLKVLEPPPPGVLVQPVHLDYGPVAEEIGWVGVEAGQDNAIRLLTRPGSFRVVAHFLEPFSPADFPGRKAISAEARLRIETALVAALGKPLRPFTWHSVPGVTV
jgi:1-acyl-sn-glycerol-3-phosphate acyltransferase